MTIDDAKRAAARAALAELPDEGVIGLGTGSTTRFFIDAVGEAVKQGKKYISLLSKEKMAESPRPRRAASRRASSASHCSATTARGTSRCASTAPTRSIRIWI